MPPIELTEEQKQVVETRGRPVQVIACAGSGKTESVSRRISALIDEGESPDSIVAFTFTEKAASELKDRVYSRIRESQGEDFLGRLGPMFIGTIHGYCFRLLQDHVPHYGNYDVLDEHRHLGFLSREYRNLGLHRIGARHWQPIRDFAKSVDVIGNELISTAELEGTDLGECYEAYLEALDRYHFLTFGMIISKAVEALGQPDVFERVHSPLRHLIVDEYQDVNPAQERLIAILSQDPVQLCVVGDDDQSIYQWRGSEVANILTFSERVPNTKPIKLETNRRSRPQIVTAANQFAESIQGRLEKSMRFTRPEAGCELTAWTAETEDEEAARMAEAIVSLRDAGYRYQDIGILYRSVRTSAPALIAQLEEREIPYSCGGRTGLFVQPEINLFGEIFAWIASADWRDERYGQARPADLNTIVSGLNHHFGNGDEIPGLRQYLDDWRNFRMRSNRPVSLVGDFYKLLDFLGAHHIDIDSPEGSARFGAFARFSELLADFEHVTRRGRYVTEADDRVFRGGRDRGKPYFQKLHNYLLHYARDAYEDFEGERSSGIDAVDILTVHQAKGLEWPVVFLPALTSLRFPSRNAGRAQSWLFSEELFPTHLRSRYEGGDNDERRLFYVAMTRARDALYMSCFKRINRTVRQSPYFQEIANGVGVLDNPVTLPLPPSPKTLKDYEAPPLEVSFSDIANFEDCGFSYRLSKVFGFQQELAIELGYGKALHHVLRLIAENSRNTGKIPTPEEASQIVDEEFYLPFADNPTFTRMHRAAGTLVELYLNHYSEDLLRVWSTERPFEVHFDGAALAGRADIILDEEDGQIGSLAIVDYKTAQDPLRDERYELQLSVYGAAARGEGLNVVAGYLHELKDGTRRNVDISSEAGETALNRIEESIVGIRASSFPASPSTDKCSICDFRLLCRFRTQDRAPDRIENGEAAASRSSDLQGHIIQRILGASNAEGSHD